jgi:hypothetical protein
MARQVTKTNENALAPLRAELPLVVGGATTAIAYTVGAGLLHNFRILRL